MLYCIAAFARAADAGVALVEAETHRQLLAQLDAAEYEQREAATRALMGDTALTRQRWRELWDAAISAGGTPEQVHRLAAVGVHVTVREQIEPFLSDEHAGALGIHHVGVAADADEPDLAGAGAQPGSGAGVRVIKTAPGFPAHAVLRAGDTITAIDSRPLAGGAQAGADTQSAADDLVRRIRDIGCGKTATLTLLRDGRVLDVEVTLSSQPVLHQIISRGLAAEAEAAILRELDEAHE
jgi:hypothetical protein